MSAINNISNSLGNLSIQDAKSSTIEEIAKNNPPTGWEEVFKDAAPELKKISDTIAQYEKEGYTIYPKKEDIFNAFRLTDLNNVKVVVIGQDPYHSTEINGQPTAMGLAFSVSKNAKVPPSLQNIYKELAREYTDFKIPNHGDLSGWATQGVMLLNMSLTVNKGSAGSHGNLWMPFIEKIINAINKHNKSIIYVLWGNPAKTVMKYIPKDAIILTSSHPSPLSVNKTANPFNSNNHFFTINELLVKLGKTPINWQL